jgi:hypothetical protein
MAERTQEEQERLAHVVDGVPAWRLVRVMNETVGPKRAMELTGWAVVWGMNGETSGAELRRKLQAQGIAQSAAYRALDDYRRIGDALLALPEYTGPSVFASLRHLAALMLL